MKLTFSRQELLAALLFPISTEMRVKLSRPTRTSLRRPRRVRQVSAETRWVLDALRVQPWYSAADLRRLANKARRRKAERQAALERIRREHPLIGSLADIIKPSDTI